MQFFSGIVSLSQSTSVSHQQIELLERTLSRHAGDRPRIFLGDRHAVAHVDLQSSPSAVVWHDSDGSLACLAGDPVIACADGAAEPSLAISILHKDWQIGRSDVLQRARGTFCCVHLDPAADRIRLASDKLGIRPLYYARSNDCLIFSCSLRMMLVLAPHLNYPRDLTACAQQSAMGYILSNRTVHEHIRRLAPGVLLDIVAGQPAESVYWDWSRLSPFTLDRSALCNELQHCFSQAVHLRLGSQHSAVAQLSGGLDSRCVIAAMRQAGAQVHSINFAPAGSVDCVLGRQAAQALGTHHFELQKSAPAGANLRIFAHQQWRLGLGADELPELPHQVWSGHGGDAVLAQTTATPDLLLAQQSGDVEKVLQIFFRNSGFFLPRHIFRTKHYAIILAALNRSVHAELQRCTSTELARGLRTFIVTQEIRGEFLPSHFEDLDLHRIDYVLPFCDADFVALALSAPPEWLARHRLYYQWLSTFPAAVQAVPWQAYPNSDPCPVPEPLGLRNQWTDGWLPAGERRLNQRRQLDLYKQMLERNDFPHELLHHGKLLFAYLLGRIGFLRYIYLLQAAKPFI
ncbi:asparagine synthase-related protein [Hydrogenophaga sp.]|uniref:asparagine synthase-related protein n=1 Tax=Hydrogenophaga sp. TaxID=1904254 RepID=UPI0019895F62|nr:asparagine synthase-related protein [Hydrogenophaga sp.]MBD3893562.1 hypothetical protein [Hydrogenophaga sp.]